MARLIRKGNIAIFEYPSGAENPEFTFGDNGNLFIYGYSISIMGKQISCAKRFELNINGYALVGRYNEAKQAIQGDFSDIITDTEIDTKNCVIFIKAQ